jgi:4-hydroxythreonine-4-phosphate dehydrogenase
MTKPIWITEGDPTGISRELVAKNLILIRELSQNRPIIYIQSQSNFENFPFDSELKDSNMLIPKNGFHLICDSLSFGENLELGKPSDLSGKMSLNSLRLACEKIEQFGGDLITLPLSKEWVIKSGYSSFKGHTEYLSDHFKQPTFMIMYSEEFSVIPLTTHIPLKIVTEKLKSILWDELFNSISKSSIFQAPKIGVCGINPHAGEDGLIGDEEITILKPVLEKYKNQGWDIEGPISGDSIFQEDFRNRYNLIFAMYHDQGLIPFKAIAGKKGINLTVGLNFVRVSPDHGTAFGIAGKNLADPSSLESCLRFISKH